MSVKQKIQINSLVKEPGDFGNGYYLSYLRPFELESWLGDGVDGETWS